MQKEGCTTALFRHTSNDEVLYDDSLMSNPIMGFFCYDVELHWSQVSVRSARRAFGQSKEYLAVGPMGNFSWAPDDANMTNYASLPEGHNYVLSAFPSTYVSNVSGMVNSVEGHRAFLEFIQELLETRSGCSKVLWKGKYPYSEYLNSNDQELVRVASSLKRSKKFIEIDEASPAYEVAGQSHVSLSMPFCSPGIEALLLGRRSFYVDLVDEHPRAYYKRFPGLVAGSPGEALEYLRDWLNLGGDEVKNYVTEHLSAEFPNFSRSETSKSACIRLIQSAGKESQVHMI